MNYIRIAIILSLSRFACVLLKAGDVTIVDVSHSVPAVTTGHVLEIQETIKVENIGVVRYSKLLYVSAGAKLLPGKSIQGVERVLIDEKFRWGKIPEMERMLIPSFCELYAGASVRLLDEAYYIIRLDADPQDRETLLRLKATCKLPIIKVTGTRWSMTFFTIQEGIGVCPVDRYTVEGITAPFKIVRCTVEDADPEGLTVLKNPPPE